MKYIKVQHSQTDIKLSKPKVSSIDPYDKKQSLVVEM